MFRLTRNSKLVEDLSAGSTKSSEITAAEQAMLDYAAKLTQSLDTVQKSDIDFLREYKFTDKAILEMNQIAGYFAYVNRLASGLGVELEDFWHREPVASSRSAT